MAKTPAKAQTTEVAEWGDYDGPTGMENADRSELAIPFINLLQSNSEVVEAGNAKAGQFYDNVMETVVDEIEFIPCARQRVFVEWVPVDDGGGLVAIHQPESDFVQKAIAANDGNARDLQVPGEKVDKHDLVETIYLYVMARPAGSEENFNMSVISFASSKLKKYRGFFTRANAQQILVGERKITLPLWAHRWKMGSEEEVSKRNGKKFKNVTLDWADGDAASSRFSPKDPLFQAAKEFHDMVADGGAKADLSTADGADGADHEKKDGGAEIPF